MKTTELANDLLAMSAKMAAYLEGDELYKTVTVQGDGGDRLIKMTLGGMLERIRALRAHAPHNPAIVTAEKALQEARSTQPDAYYARLAREAKSYAGSWNWFLQECWDNTDRCEDDYATEVPIRLRIAHLLEAGGTRPEMREVRQQVEALDRRLREIWQPTDHPVIRDGEQYDRSQYWWLYGEPKPRAE
ncbi:MAG: hypothetical protein KDD73_08945 [Anaerolineales bacterium]|nr:hypothetical protein [Anaerolineales bacterium]MCB9128270.1 hypothetical protein [Ardenticatenales bacterium]MCB9172061.1 hypothetical protein [Ardenticatenales bacterium]